MKAVGSFAGGIASYDAGKYTRKMMRFNERNALDEGTAEQERIRAAARESMGRQLVGQAASAFQVGTGSALDELAQSAADRELDILNSRRNAKSKADAFKQKGQLAYAQGKAALASGIISGAASLVETAVSAGAFGGAGGAAGGDAGAAGVGDINMGGGTAAFFANNNPFGA